MSRAEAKGGSFVQLKEEPEKRRAELLEAPTFGRPPVSWYKARVGELKAEARQRDMDGGIFLTNCWKAIYARGLLHTGTVRAFAVSFPMDQEGAASWVYPYLDDQRQV